VSRSLRRRLNKGDFELRFDTAFDEVMQACAGPRRQHPEGGTWINADMQAAYGRLHRLGFAHSAELWIDGALVGGLYGVALGRVFFGESMFSRVTDASKIVLISLAQRLQEWGFALLDCQVHSEHLATLGSVRVPRQEFLRLLADHSSEPVSDAAWRDA
jgi:leucyl/phenylalanyl-tRNA--protein transferase